MPEDVKTFLNYPYTELKDLAKAFLTLISAILVFSITFSDKIIEFPTAGQRARMMLVASWASFAVSILMCGIALCINYQAAVIATLSNENGFLAEFLVVNIQFLPGSYRRVWYYGGLAMLFAGVFFAAGILLLLVSSVRCISTRASATVVPVINPGLGQARTPEDHERERLPP